MLAISLITSFSNAEPNENNATSASANSNLTAESNATNSRVNSNNTNATSTNSSVNLSEQNATNSNASVNSNNAGVNLNANLSENNTTNLNENNATSASLNESVNSALNPQNFWQTNKDNAYEVLKHEQGIYAQDAIGSDPAARAFVRGFELKRVYLDGIEFSDFYMGNDLRFVGVFGDTQLYKGFLPSSFSGLGGALNVVSAKPQREFEAKIGFKSLYNNVGLDGVQTQKYLNVGTNGGSYYISVDYADIERDNVGFSKDYTNTYEGIRRVSANGALENRFVKLGVGFYARENDEYALHYLNQKGNKGELIEENRLSNVTVSNNNLAPKVPNYAVYDSQMLYALGRTGLGENLSLESKLFYGLFDKQKVIVNAFTLVQVSGAENVISEYDGVFFGGNLALHYAMSENLGLKFGAKMRRKAYEFSTEAISATNFHNNVKRTEFDAKELESSLFAEFAGKFGAFGLNLGASYDRADMLSASVLTDSTAGIYSSAKHSAGRKLSFGNFALQILASYELSGAQSLYASVAKKNEVPNFYERYFAGVNSGATAGTALVADSNLRYESVLSYELGYRLNLENANLSAALFYNDLLDMLAVESRANGENKLTNKNAGYTYGGELGAMIRANELWAFGANYAFLQGWRSQNDGAGHKLAYYPHHIANAKVAFAPVKMIEFIALGNFQSAENAATSAGYEKGHTNYTFDLLANLHFGKGLSFNAGIYNLADRDNYATRYNAGLNPQVTDGIYRYHFAGRRYFIGFEYKYQK